MDPTRVRHDTRDGPDTDAMGQGHRLHGYYYTSTTSSSHLLLKSRAIVNGIIIITLLLSLSSLSSLKIQCSTAADATSILLENSRQKIVPLLQMFLYSEQEQ